MLSPILQKYLTFQWDIKDNRLLIKAEIITIATMRIEKPPKAVQESFSLRASTAAHFSVLSRGEEITRKYGGSVCAGSEPAEWYPYC